MDNSANSIVGHGPGVILINSLTVGGITAGIKSDPLDARERSGGKSPNLTTQPLDILSSRVVDHTLFCAVGGG